MNNGSVEKSSRNNTYHNTNHWSRWTAGYRRIIASPCFCAITELQRCRSKLGRIIIYPLYTMTNATFVITACNLIHDGHNSLSSVVCMLCHAVSYIGCVNGYSWSAAIPNTNVLGGTANGATSIAACQSACSSSTICLGIDWSASNPVGQQCYIIYTTTPGPRYNGTAAGTTHYDYTIINCNGD